MARSYKRDAKGRFSRTSGGSKGKKKKTLKQRYQKGEKGAGAIHRRRAKQWKSGRKRDKAKVIAKTGFGPLWAGVHAASYANNKRVQRKKRKKRR